MRVWLRSLSREDRLRVVTDIATVEFGWPVGMPTCRPLGEGLWEIRSDLVGNRTARVLFCFAESEIVLLHGFIKKTRRTPQPDLELAMTRRKALEQ